MGKFNGSRIKIPSEAQFVEDPTHINALLNRLETQTVSQKAGQSPPITPKGKIAGINIVNSGNSDVGETPFESSPGRYVNSPRRSVAEERPVTKTVNVNFAGETTKFKSVMTRKQSE